ncbi:sec-independent protein translocase protein TatC [Halohasta litchfieldiae]|jgi:sec-independent protein translocase protein TatC|uniref:Sec-independent protein translocase protein TatC n=1 Tax=Halohasta litchfieldiae TaxID=1073996 RepID=A0A1H6VJ92_9EURY|nr:twin-arginine translocase subunit TatC [Halohasta litchfieldiae]ATW88934.1 sec-independent protein translocase protein TatC [Halohasta litchfieldiae]SEJ00820.1 sec-independent protein translocase protein TatC [Halohasta litchfieldiae]
MAEQPDAGDTDETASDAVADPPVDSDASDAPVDASTDSVDSTTADSADPADPADDTTTDGGTTQSGLPADELDQPDTSVVDDGMVGDGPQSDQEMPLADHIEEMMRRLGVVFLVAGIVTILVYPFAGETINFLWASHIPEAATNRPRLYGPLEFILTKLKVAGLAGILIGLPVFVYQTYRFMRPGLYPQERRYYLSSVPTSLVLGIFGVLFAHFLILPFIFAYFSEYTEDAAVVAFGLQETFNLILIMMGWMALIFQIPLFIMLAIMMGIVTREWLEAKRLIFWGSFLGIAFIFSPDPTGMAPIIVTLTMVVLFEGTLAIRRWTGN